MANANIEYGIRLPQPARPAAAGPTVVYYAAIALTWLTIASGGIVFAEPAPVDVLMMGTILALPVVGLVAFRPILIVVFAVWLVIGALTLLAAVQALDVGRAATHTSISIYLYASFFVIAAFIAYDPKRNVPLIMGGYVCAALIAGAAGIIGFFELLPDAQAVFTKFGRASGTFKDPNVYGPFLIPPLLYMLHLTVSRSIGGSILAGSIFVVLMLALVVSFSRGALLNLGLALAVYGFLAFATAPSWRRRFKFIALLAFGTLSLVLVLTIALRIPEFTDLLHQRAQLFQNYDVGPEGRFGGQAKALDLILSSPFGIGAMEFAGRFHHEAAHNVYLTIGLRGGWLAGLLYIGLMIATVLVGLAHAIRRTQHQQIFIVAYSALIGLMVQGLLVDTDHWRHSYIVLALIWGLVAAGHAGGLGSQAVPRRPGRIVRPRLRLRRYVAPRRPGRIAGPLLATVNLAIRPWSKDVQTRRPKILVRARGRSIVRQPKICCREDEAEIETDIIRGEPAMRRIGPHRPRRPQFMAYN